MNAIGDYFRTALLIDDRVESDYGSLEPLDVEGTSTASDEPESGLEPPPKEDETPVGPSSLVSAFLAANVVCSVLQAREDDSDLRETALRGASIADLLILDWLLFGSGDATVDVIREINVQSKARLRVIVVFTGASSLNGVVEQLREKAQFDKIDDFVLRRDSTVVLVFGKPGPRLTGGEETRQPSSYRELPDMIRTDLEVVFKGLMPEFAFRGINTLRESAPRILATFSADLDAGALVHRALLPEPLDAGSQFVRLLASDFEEALHDKKVRCTWDPENVSSFLAATSLDGRFDELVKQLKSNEAVQGHLRDATKQATDRELASRAIIEGLARLGMKDNSVSKAVEPLVAAVGDPEGVKASNESLAVLMSSSSLGEAPPRLESGIVLKDEDHKYWLCIQPLCDSVRLDSSRAFPMLPITVEPAKPAAMIRSIEGDAIGIGFDSSPHSLAMPKFDPSEDGSVIASGDYPNWHFAAADGTEYQAITRLRPEVAAQAVHGLVQRATRTGADTSEWLRRKARSASA